MTSPPTATLCSQSGLQAGVRLSMRATIKIHPLFILTIHHQGIWGTKKRVQGMAWQLVTRVHGS